MPIDPSIVGGLKPAVIPDPLVQATRAAAYGNELQKSAINEQQIREGALDLEAKGRAAEEGRRLRELFAQPGMTIEAAIPQVYAINPTTGLALQKGVHEQQKAALDNQKTQLENNKNTAERLGSIAASIHDEGSFHAGIAQATGEGLIPPAAAKQLLDEGFDEKTQAKVAQIVQQSQTSVQQHDQAIADVKEKREALAAQQETELKKYQIEKGKNEATTTKPNENGLTAEQQLQEENRKAQLQATKDRDKNTALDEAERRRLEADRLKVEQRGQSLREKQYDATIGMGRDANGQPLKDPTTGKALTGEALLATLPPGRAAQVRAFAEGRETQLPRGKEQQPFLDLVNQYDPAFTNQRAETRKAFAPGGASGKNIQSLNTAAVHLDQLGEAAKALDNGSFRPGNAVFNNVISLFGGSAPTNFEGVKAAVSSEMASALKGNATDQEIAANARVIDAAGSPKQLAGIVDEQLKVLGVKLNTKDEEYHKAIPSDADYSPVLPTSKGVFEKHGIQPIQRLSPASAPGVHKVPSVGDTFNGSKVLKIEKVQ